MPILGVKVYMDLNKAIDLVKAELVQSRFEHTLRVAEVSKELAVVYGVAVDKVQLAAILHDYAKNWPSEKLKSYILDNGLPRELLDFDKELWHGPVGAHLFENQYGVVDQDILNAIRFHTTGRAEMSLVEMILYLADYIEPGRSFPGLQEVRQASEKNLKYACWLVARNTIMYLMKKNATIHPDSFYAYNDFTRYIKTEGLLNG